MEQKENTNDEKKSSFKRSSLKKNARKNIKHHYIRNILVAFLAAIIINGGYFLNTNNIYNIEEIQIQNNTYKITGKKSNTEIIADFLIEQNDGEEPEPEQKNNYTAGVLNVLINETTNSGSLILGFLNAFNQLYFEGKVSAFVTILIFTILSLIIYFLVQNVIVIGRNRYFLEQRKYLNTTVDRLLFPYKVKKTLHLSYILFCKYIYQLLWDLTIVGGFIKHYEYKLIPYVLAENPNLSKKEAFELSKELMQGEKWKVFKLDCTLIGWKILDSLTLGLSSIFYYDAYKECIYAELYINVRMSKKESLSNPSLLNDNLLDIEETVDGTYPEEKFLIPVNTNSILHKLDYNQAYSLITYILFFFTFSFIGWCWEVFLHLLKDGAFINRGTMFGPWLPIYGVRRSFNTYFVKTI